MPDIPANSSTTATISVGGSVTNELEVLGDHDWFAINLAAGQSITVTLNGSTELVDPELFIRSANGNELYHNDDIVSGVNRDSQLAFTATNAGTYYIDVGSWQETYKGAYTLSVTTYSPPPLWTNDQIVNQLVSGFWGDGTHSFSLNSSRSISVNLTGLTPEGANLARTALAAWSEIINVSFPEVTTGGLIIFDDNAEGANTSSDYGPGGTITASYVNIETAWLTDYGTTVGSYSYQTYLHEIGHALGLGHAGNYNGEARYPYDALFQNDSWASSVMSYFSQTENTYTGGQGFTYDYLVSPMVADIIAIQKLYGAGSARGGDTTYGVGGSGIYAASTFTGANSNALTIYDTGGTDTIDFSTSSANQTINLNAETFSSVVSGRGNLSIARGTIIENATGGSGADTLIGNSVANVLRGNAGSDTLTGGAGGDSFVGTRAQLNGDTITDFSAGDKIVFTDATSGSFTFSLAGNTLTFTGGSMTLTGASGTLAASAAAGGGIQLAFAASVVRDVANDFNGDGRSDILWRNDGTGQVTDWLGQTNGSFANNSANFFSQPGLDWKVVSTGDYNGDGKDDILWRNVNTSQITNWLGQSNGSFASNFGNLDARPGLDWQVAASGDFNGDGKDDILWRNSGTGQTIDWLGQSNGGFVSNTGNFDARPGLDWQVASTGDFNGDGKDDILWRNSSTGQVIDWLGQANGSFASNTGNFDARPGLDWKIVGTGDFNGDGKDDILWRNSGTGQITDWLGQANGSFVSNIANLDSRPGLNWHVAGIGDYNGDGKDDILWRNDGGTLIDWLATTNGSFASNGGWTSTVDTGWQVQSHDVLFL